MMNCWHCGEATHKGQCPRIAAITFFADGKVKKVLYHPFRPVGTPIPEEELARIAELAVQGALKCGKTCYEKEAQA
jgi:hypothetical protein